MSLRRRLLAAMGTVLLLLVVGGASLIRSQQAFLIEQVDHQLAATLPVADRPSPNRPTPPPGDNPAPDAPISRLFIGVISNGELTPLIRGQLIVDSPEPPTDPAELDLLGNAAVTTDGTNGTRFRMRVSPLPEPGDYFIVAIPLDEVDSAIGRLQLVLAIVGALVLLAVTAAVWWVERLGINPIVRVTEAAEAISAGDRSPRVHVTDPRTEAGKLAHAFNLMLDDRDAAEHERRQFVADASHELRTPLTSIQGYLDLYGQGRFTDPQQVDGMVRRMTREASRMKDLVEDLLLLANLDQQRPLQREAVDVNRLLTDAASDGSAVQPDRPIVVEPSDQPVQVTGDQFRLQQVVGALVDNALTHTEPSVKVLLTARLADDGAEIVVADEGPGLPAEMAARVFDRFFRGDESRSRRTGNSGLGLAIAHSIVEAHGGTIRLETSPGEGCRFIISLPADGPPVPVG